MAADRLIYFKKGEAAPTKDEIESLLRNYFSGAATEIEWKRDRFYVTLHGHPSFPFTDVAPDVPNPHEGDGERERWIEVWLDRKDGTVDVMTRQMDHYTNALADDVARTIARYWRGRLEDD